MEGGGKVITKLGYEYLILKDYFQVIAVNGAGDSPEGEIGSIKVSGNFPINLFMNTC